MGSSRFGGVGNRIPTGDFHYRRAGREIIDATVDGKLDIFPKISFEEAIEICGKK